MVKELLLITIGSPGILILTSHLNTNTPELVIVRFSLLTLTTPFGLVGELASLVTSMSFIVHVNTLANFRS